MTPTRILHLTLNGVDREVSARPHDFLLDVLRERVHLTGTKRGCDMGTCGCCTVLVDGEARLSCLTLAAQVEGRDVRTIESMGGPGALHPIQAAFNEAGASQCGFCTPGFIMTTKALLDRDPRPTDLDVRRALAGNLCRCTGYVKIFEAVQKAARQLDPRRGDEEPPAADEEGATEPTEVPA